MERDAHRSFDDLVDTAAASRDDLSKVFESLCCLCLDSAIYDGHGGWIEWDATGDEDEAIGLDRLRVWSDRGGSIWGE
jgi:hypothetical protein